MAEGTKIIGVDYSGSASDVPWITTAGLEGDHLKLQSCEPIDREKLTNRLLAEDTRDAVVGMDFPFGVAKDLFPDLKLGEYTMDDVWDFVAQITEEDFFALCNNHQHTKRGFDKKHYTISQSPQNIRMRYMTYYGIKMLKELHDKCNSRWHVPPLHPGKASRGRVTLLEVMPGTSLKEYKLPHANYKTSKGPKALKNLKNRKEIIEKLPGTFAITMPNFSGYRDLCLFNDDALDSIVAAVIAALWAENKPFHSPENHDADVLDTARFEGCIYTPRKVTLAP